MTISSFSISSVERDTGLSKDVLRVWERRYGFPLPIRDASGERSYSVDQVERLRLIKRLIDKGHRPGKLISLPIESLKNVAPRIPIAPQDANSSDVLEIDALFDLIKHHSTIGYKHLMQRHLARLGLQRFVRDIVAPLTVRIGQAWENGHLDIFEEHLFAELTIRFMRMTIDTLPGGNCSPKVLITTLPGEQHSLGLLMAESILALEGAECISLGIQLPLLEIVHAASNQQVDIVALSFSTAFPHRQIPDLLKELRRLLKPEISLWAGGGGIAKLVKMDEILFIPSLDSIAGSLTEWRALHSDKTVLG